jgi:hypothetical protein
MARVNKGKSLSTLELQPGWVIEDDGFGLLTASVVYKTSHGTSTGTPATGAEALGKTPQRGDPFPQDGRMHCHRASSSLDANGIQTISVDYVGIAKGNTTIPNVSGRFSSNQEPISTHPKFVSDIGGNASTPKNGAVFNDDGSFKRFANSTPPLDQFYGVTSYLACGFGITGHFYTSDFGILSAMKESLGTTSSTGNFGGPNLLGDFGGLSTGQPGWTGYGNWITPREDDQLLLSGVQAEYFGKLIKISYDIMYSQDGWNGSIYGRRSLNESKPKDSKASTWKGKGSYYQHGTSFMPKTLG